jgi:cytochrome c-type protein NapC
MEIMASPDKLIAALFVVTAALLLLCVLRPSLTATREGKILAFVVLCVLPLACSAVGFNAHMERSKSTQFCLSCHLMEPYGKSLWVDDAKYIPASHYQNHRIPAESACFTCHTDYAMYGDIRAKMRGLHHVYVQYLGTPMQPLHLYVPFNNRECLHCHLGARSFEESPTHSAMRADLVSNSTSCLTSGCHDTVHNVAALGSVKFWKEPN